MTIDCGPHLRGLLRDETLTRGLGDIEARMLVEWIAAWVELLAGAATCDLDVSDYVRRIRRRGRAIACFVVLWTDIDPRARGAAFQLAASEKFDWPLPRDHVEPADLMQRILQWESEHWE